MAGSLDCLVNVSPVIVLSLWMSSCACQGDGNGGGLTQGDIIKPVGFKDLI